MRVTTIVTSGFSGTTPQELFPAQTQAHEHINTGNLSDTSAWHQFALVPKGLGSKTTTSPHFAPTCDRFVSGLTSTGASNAARLLQSR